MRDDEVKCDGYPTVGRRPRMHPAPEGWLYIEARDGEVPDAWEGTTYVYACSPACAAGLWRQGPGPRFDPAERARSSSRG